MSANVARSFSLVSHDPKGSHYKSRPTLENMAEKTCSLRGGTIVLLDSLQIYVNNSFMELVICHPARSESSPGPMLSIVKKRFFGRFAPSEWQEVRGSE